MRYKNHYIIQEKSQHSIKDKIFSLLKAPVLLPQWVVSFFLSRAMTNVILSPGYAAPQKQIHLIHLTDEPSDKGQVIINLLPKDSHKIVHDYLLKLSTVLHLSFLIPKRKQLALNNPLDKAHIDHLIAEIKALHEGSSTVKQCVGVQFNLDELHLKGSEYLDEALRTYLYQQLKTQCGWNEEQRTHSCLSFYSLETYDNAVLDSLAFSSVKEEKKPMAQRKFIINCLANGQNYINWIKDFNATSKELECTVIGFNYRGIDYSKGLIWTENNMVDDVLAQVRFLLDQGVKPEHIGLDGMCVGGAVATLAVARAQKEGIHIGLYNERSFRSIPRVLAGSVLPGVKRSLWNPLTWLQYLLGAVVYAVTTPIIWISGWHMDVAHAWNQIPAHRKNYSVVRNYVDSDPKAPAEDCIIEDSWASLASFIDEQRAVAKNKQKSGDFLNPEEMSLVNDMPEMHYFKINPAFDRKNKYPHVLARRHLIQSNAQNPINMQEHMQQSFKTIFFETKPPHVLSIPSLNQEYHYAL